MSLVISRLVRKFYEISAIFLVLGIFYNSIDYILVFRYLVFFKMLSYSYGTFRVSY